MHLPEQFPVGPSPARLRVYNTLIALSLCVDMHVVASTTHTMEQPPLSATETWLAIQSGETVFDQHGIIIQACDPVPQTTKNEANALLDASFPQLNTLRSVFPLPQEGKAQANSRIAAEHGIHYPNSDIDTLDELVRRGNWDHPYTYYLEYTQDFMQREFGVTVRLGREGDLGIDSPENILTAADLETVTAKQSIMNAVLAFRRQTKEMVELSGMKEIIFVKNSGFGGVANTGKPGRPISISIVPGVATDQSTYDHEFAHDVTTELCGSPEKTSDDPEYAAFNTSSDVYSKDSNASTYDGAGMAALSAMQYQALNAVGDSTPMARTPVPPYCKVLADQQRIGAQVQTASAYHPTIPEDEAELGKALGNPLDASRYLLPESNTPILDAKLRLLFARLYAKAPNLAEYYAAMHVWNRQQEQSETTAAPSCGLSLSEALPVFSEATTEK